MPEGTGIPQQIIVFCAERSRPTTVISWIRQCKCTDLDSVLKHLSPDMSLDMSGAFFCAESNDR
jgi:hypothetical protein